jgi:hypothetical protein
MARRMVYLRQGAGVVTDLGLVIRLSTVAAEKKIVASTP